VVNAYDIRYRALDPSWSRCTGSQPASDYKSSIRQ